jgi:hypothetical protein
VRIGAGARVTDSVVTDGQHVDPRARLRRVLVLPGPRGRGRRQVEVGE